MDAGARASGSFELHQGSPNDRAGVLPVASLRAARLLEPWLVYGSLRLGFPAYYGQQAAGLGVGVETLASESSTHRVFVYAALEAGASLSYLAAPPEVQYHPEAAMYWGPYARIEMGVRVFQHPPGALPFGLVVAAGVDLTPARYVHPEEGRGLRLGVDLGLGGEYRF